ncbi:MAG: iron ABC transporter permease [Bacteroidota bacterium]
MIGRNLYTRLWLLGLAMVLSALLATKIGAVEISVSQILQSIGQHLGLPIQGELPRQVDAIIWGIRLPRVLMSLLVGGALALCGAAMQGLFRNPLADPSILGVSTSAALTTSIAIVLLGPYLSSWQEMTGIPMLPLAAFVGAVSSIYLIFGMSRSRGKIDVSIMLLGGIAINALAGAGIGLLTYLADDAQLRSLTFWTLGSLGGVGWKQLGIMLLALTSGLLLLLPMVKDFNALSLGETEARHLGSPVESLKRRVVLATGLCMGVAVAFCGVIGFVGLVVPHMLRLSGGGHHHYLLPASVLAGGVLLCWADAFSRVVVAPAELPIGVLTAMAGSPIFLFLLLRQNRR